MSVVPNENNVTLFREIYRKMGLFEIKYSIKFEEKINLMLFLFAQELIPNTSIAYVDSFTF
jgi:hypothetical protein